MAARERTQKISYILCEMAIKYLYPYYSFVHFHFITGHNENLTFKKINLDIKIKIYQITFHFNLDKLFYDA
jgi:hypothetical protein